MINKAKIFRLVVITILMVSFTTAYIIDFPVLSNLSTCKVQNAKIDTNEHSSMKNCCVAKNAVKKTCCCKKITLSILSDIPKVLTQYENKFVIFSKISNKNLKPYNFIEWATHQQPGIFFQNLPPKIPDIRIFIQSFLI